MMTIMEMMMMMMMEIMMMLLMMKTVVIAKVSPRLKGHNCGVNKKITFGCTEY
jgi:hypothetical protein